jgi:multiple sugar transport system permease protein
MERQAAKPLIENRPHVMVKQAKKWGKETVWAILLISPTFLGLLTFYIGPAIASFALSFTYWDGLTQPSFAGLDNITALISSPVF